MLHLLVNIRMQTFFSVASQKGEKKMQQINKHLIILMGILMGVAYSS